MHTGIPSLCIKGREEKKINKIQLQVLQLRFHKGCYKISNNEKKNYNIHTNKTYTLNLILQVIIITASQFILQLKSLRSQKYLSTLETKSTLNSPWRAEQRVDTFLFLLHAPAFLYYALGAGMLLVSQEVQQLVDQVHCHVTVLREVTDAEILQKI